MLILVVFIVLEKYFFNIFVQKICVLIDFVLKRQFFNIKILFDFHCNKKVQCLLVLAYKLSKKASGIWIEES